MVLLSIDLGTTHVKICLFDDAGREIYISSCPNLAQSAPGGYVCYEPDLVWENVWRLVCDALGWLLGNGGGTVQAIGVTGMAETGLLVDRRTGAPRSMMLPWFDPAATAQADELRRRFDVQERFYAGGIRLTFKCSIAKLLWLRQNDAHSLDGAVWLGAPEYIVYRLSGQMAIDASLAVRTGALRIANRAWDVEWLAELGLAADIFPPVLPGGAPAGGLRAALAKPGLPAGTPVAVCGHDHICAAFAADALLSGGQAGAQAFDSMGTAESLAGALDERSLGEAEWLSGFSFGCHVHPGKLYWASGLSTSGGSIEWLRSILGDPPLAYADLDALLERAPDRPGSLLFLPYLAGSGAPHSDPKLRGGFIGLDARHSRDDLYRAVLEGTAFEMEYARRKAELLTGLPITQLAAAGGGTRNRRWLQIKADISGCRVVVLPEAQATALGAALLAGLGSGVYPEWVSLTIRFQRASEAVYLPDESRHAEYQERFAKFDRLQSMLRVQLA